MAVKSYWQQFERQRISRRKLLVASGAGAAGIAVVTACGGGKKSGTQTGTPGGGGTPKPGGRYKEATAVISDAVFGLDPHLAVAAGLEYFARMYNVLLNRSAVRPDFYYYDLAADDGLEMPEPSGQVFIFTMRPGVMIPENNLGVPSRAMDANDAFATFDRIKGDPALNRPGLTLANACQFVCQYFTKHEVTDAMHYRVETSVPYAWFLYNIGRAINTIPPKELIDDTEKVGFANSKMKSAGVGGGPFQIPGGAFIEGERVSMEKNPIYYRTGRPLLDGWDVTIIPDRPALRSAFISKDTYQYGAATDDEVNELTKGYDVYKASDNPTYTFIAFTMNVTRDPWKDPKIRKAAMYALNRQEYVERVYQGAAKANGLVHWCVAGALSDSDLAKLQPFDPEMSKRLIKEATGQDRISVKVMFPTGQDIEEIQEHLPIFLQQMKNAGFDIEGGNQDPRDLAGWLTAYRTKDYDASLSLNQIYETAEIPLDFQHSKGPAGSDAYATGLQDPQIDAVIDATKRITDFDERVKAIQDAQKMIYEAGPAFLPLVTPYSRTLYWNFVKDVPVGLATTDYFLRHGMWLNL